MFLGRRGYSAAKQKMNSDKKEGPQLIPSRLERQRVQGAGDKGRDTVNEKPNRIDPMLLSRMTSLRPLLPPSLSISRSVISSSSLQ
ncbi:Hypothetical protein NTJ_03999 [Nesidiocoris tenuis]|uniref:Uncharacterized protein n=1 Tax=Nesidiocoris tenuis TaxID=355587 RepID=A0ABN7AFY8_9HEMI|nr:Hypothetical protein NTJ_03999 [Nesidiocoris tenuis]